jgi:soluble lytic murein transglycosylase-like protein
MPTPARVQKYQPLATSIGVLTNLDPALLLAVMDRESRCGEALKPPGPTGTGDGGHGRGLMQIDDRSHGPFIASADWRGVALWKLPEFNLLYAAKLLRANLDALSGDVAGALCAYNAGIGTARRVSTSLAPDAPLAERVKAYNAFTANGDYVSDVLARRESFAIRI